jgi:hypothetical protein
MTNTSLQRIFLEVFAELDRNGGLQTSPLLSAVRRKIREAGIEVPDQSVLAYFNDLYRAGFFGWGLNLHNPDPPFMHLSEVGRLALAQASRDPFNPDGYLAHLRKDGALSPIVEAYISEALSAFNSACFRAAVMMVGCAAERTVLDLREKLAHRIEADGGAVPRGLNDWRIKRVLDAIEGYFGSDRGPLDRHLREEFDAHWASFSGQIRLARNSAGHPASLDAVDPPTAHGALLIFPELARLARKLSSKLES